MLFQDFDRNFGKYVRTIIIYFTYEAITICTKNVYNFVDAVSATRMKYYNIYICNLNNEK